MVSVAVVGVMVPVLIVVVVVLVVLVPYWYFILQVFKCSFFSAIAKNIVKLRNANNNTRKKYTWKFGTHVKNSSQKKID